MNTVKPLIEKERNYNIKDNITIIQIHLIIQKDTI